MTTPEQPACAECDRLREERDEADRRAGAAERELVRLRDDARKLREWNDDAKAAAGYHRNVSFDVVWADALAALKERADLAAETARLRAELDQARADSRRWLPIESAPQDGTELLLGWWETWPRLRWRQEAKPAGNLDVATPGSGYAHGRATHWQSLPPPPAINGNE